MAGEQCKRLDDPNFRINDIFYDDRITIVVAERLFQLILATTGLYPPIFTIPLLLEYSVYERFHFQVVVCCSFVAL